MNAAAALETRIHAGIPLSRAMQFHIAALEEHAIRVEAPLDPNINVHGTGFAGSLYALGILTAWGMGAHLIALAGHAAELVVAEASIRYRVPVTGDIVCACRVDPVLAQVFSTRLQSHGRARLALEVAIGDPAAATIQAQMHARSR